jgi:hypothetical protein
VAVTSCQWKNAHMGNHVVRLFLGSGVSWLPFQVLASGFGAPGGAHGQLSTPCGVRFTGDGAGLVVADWGNDRVSTFRVADGSFVRHVVTDVRFPADVEECEGGWLVTVRTIVFVGSCGGCGRQGRLWVRGLRCPGY